MDFILPILPFGVNYRQMTAYIPSRSSCVNSLSAWFRSFLFSILFPVVLQRQALEAFLRFG